MGDFKQLKVWRRSRDLVLAVYEASADFPESEREGLHTQMRRAAISIASNIAESRGRYTSRDQRRFLRMAQGSAREIECQSLIARDLGLVTFERADNLLKLVDEVQRMLAALIRTSRPGTAPTKGVARPGAEGGEPGAQSPENAASQEPAQSRRAETAPPRAQG